MSLSRINASSLKMSMEEWGIDKWKWMRFSGCPGSFASLMYPG